MKTEWKELLKWFPNSPTLFPDCYEVEIPLPVLNDIFKQLKEMINKRCVFLLPHPKDYEIFHNLTDEKFKYHYDSHIIGSIVDIAKNVDNYISPTDHVYVKIEIDEKFDVLPLDRAYELHIALNDGIKDKIKYTIFEPYETLSDGWTPIDYSEKFVLKSCKVKGLYLKPINNRNDHFTGGQRLSVYYAQLSLGLLILLPGRAYM